MENLGDDNDGFNNEGGCFLCLIANKIEDIDLLIFLTLGLLDTFLRLLLGFRSRTIFFSNGNPSYLQMVNPEISFTHPHTLR